MKHALPRVLTALMAVLLAFQLSVLAAPSPTADAMTDMLIQSGGAASFQYALADGGEMVMSGVSQAEGLTAGTPYGIGSVSKMFTTAVVMRLADDGLVELDTPVVAYVPDFEMADPRYADITVRHLLNHASGLPGSVWPGALLWDSTDAAIHDTFLQTLRPMHLKADPGAFSVYCNDGFTLAEIVCERVTGQSFTELVETYIRQPLGLSGTFTPQDDFDRAGLAAAYLADGTRAPAEVLNVIGAGGIYSTAEDLARFGQIFTGYADVLSPAAQAATMAPEYLSGRWLDDIDHNVLGFGLGWDSVELFPFDRYGIPALWKGGDSTMYHASLIVLPEHGLSAAVISSGADSTANMMIAVQMLLDRLIETGVIEERLPDLEAEALPPVPLDIDVAELAGPYANTLMAYQVAFEDDGTLVLSIPAYGEAGIQRFAYVGDGRWHDAAYGATLWFVHEEGQTYLAQRQLTGLPGFGQIVMALYAAQKMPAYVPDSDVLAAWEARNGRLYFLVSEPAASVVYTQSLPVLSLFVDPGNPGYMNAFRLADADTLRSWAEIPINLGRDGADIRAFTLDGVDYLSMRGYTFISAQAFIDIWNGPRSVCTIQPSGQARWYSLGLDMAGRTLDIVCPPGAGFALYDANGQVLFHSVVHGGGPVTLPQGGWIVFVGRPGDVFDITAE